MRPLRFVIKFFTLYFNSALRSLSLMMFMLHSSVVFPQLNLGFNYMSQDKILFYLSYSFKREYFLIICSYSSAIDEHYLSSHCCIKSQFYLYGPSHKFACNGLRICTTCEYIQNIQRMNFIDNYITYLYFCQNSRLSKTKNKISRRQNQGRDRLKKILSNPIHNSFYRDNGPKVQNTESEVMMNRLTLKSLHCDCSQSLIKP